MALVNLRKALNPITNKFEAIQKAKELYNKSADINRVMLSENFSTNLNKIINELDVKMNIEIMDLNDFHYGKNVSGILMQTSPDEYVIYVNQFDIKERRRFTIAHEIGHYVLGHLNKKDPKDFKYSYEDEDFTLSYEKRDENSSRGDVPKEIAANSFAAEILMPEALTRYAYIMLGDHKQIASLFVVSPEMANIRLKSLGII